MSFFDFFKKKNEIQKKAYIQRLLNYIGDKNIYSKWYQVFNLYWGAISLFKPVLALEVYNKFKPQCVLDPCMGWGGRLVGACALDIPEYIGIDLNKNLKKPYDDMEHKLHELGTKTKIDLRFQDALTVDYSKLKYDMVFTSPPYYNIEIYNGTQERSKDEWDEKFYRPLFEKTYKCLQKGGHFILNVPEEVYERVCIPMFGKPNILIPLKIQSRGKSSNRAGKEYKINYKEFMYCWIKR